MQVLGHPAFRGSKRCHDLLHYVVEKALDEKFDELKERIIGIEVFGRPAEYDTGSDSVVRVTANEVRKRLAQFYMEGPPDCPVRIELPVGCYIPEFHLLPEPAHPDFAPEEHAAKLVHQENRDAPATPLRRSAYAGSVQPKAKRGHLWLLILIGIVFVVSNVWWWRRNGELQRNGWIASDTELPKTLPWSALLNGPERPLYVVLADVSAGTSQELLGRELSLPAYMRSDFLGSPGNASKEALELAEMMSKRPYTSAADAALASRLLQLHPILNRRITVRFARQMRIEELDRGNAILLGAGYANLWETLVEPHMNFRIEYVQAAGMHVCVNRAPKPGEPARYVPAGPTGTTGVAYAVIDLLPSPREDGHVLLLAGTNTEGTQEAGEFVMNRERFTEALKKIGVDPYGPVRHFEILLKLDAVAGSSYHSEVLSYRLIPGPR